MEVLSAGQEKHSVVFSIRWSQNTKIFHGIHDKIKSGTRRVFVPSGRQTVAIYNNIDMQLPDHTHTHTHTFAASQMPFRRRLV